MAITEQSRKQLYDGLEQVLDKEQATTLMEHLPPVGWADVATKQDLTGAIQGVRVEIEHVRSSLSAEIGHLREVMELRFARVEERFARVDDRFDRIDERFAGLDQTFATKRELADFRADMFKLIAAQTVALVIAMLTIATRLG
ncbi:MAG TPA: hypothetical protein VM938_03720 [Acidimicrobiales bacterium]|nr:hypothetical protein [Acidimicrobiales bacterium]